MITVSDNLDIQSPDLLFLVKGEGKKKLGPTYFIRKGAVRHLCSKSAWSGSSSHRWWTNVHLKEHCTTLGTCTAPQRAGFAADGFECSKQACDKHDLFHQFVMQCNMVHDWPGVFHFVAKHYQNRVAHDTVLIVLVLTNFDAPCQWLLWRQHRNLYYKSCSYVWATARPSAKRDKTKMCIINKNRLVNMQSVQREGNILRLC